MKQKHLEWPWTSEDIPSPSTSIGPTGGEETAQLAARCFRGQDGDRLLAHLRGLTLERALGPETSDSMLRHIEGQRQLVHYLCSLVQTGRGPTTQSDISKHHSETLNDIQPFSS